MRKTYSYLFPMWQTRMSTHFQYAKKCISALSTHLQYAKRPKTYFHPCSICHKHVFPQFSTCQQMQYTFVHPFPICQKRISIHFQYATKTCFPNFPYAKKMQYAFVPQFPINQKRISINFQYARHVFPIISQMPKKHKTYFHPFSICHKNVFSQNPICQQMRYTFVHPFPRCPKRLSIKFL